MIGTRHPVGRLQATNTEAIDYNTRRRIYTAANSTKLYGVIDSADWEQGTVTVSKCSLHHRDENPNVKFITQLEEFLHSFGVEELKLEGEIVITYTGENPEAHRVTVKNGEITEVKTLFSAE